MNTKISEKVVIETLLQLAFAAWCVVDDGEELPDGSVRVSRVNINSVVSHLDTLDKLPDEPGYACEAAAKARWALRELLRPQPAELAEQQGLELPSLPMSQFVTAPYGGPCFLSYTAEQMRDYARAALAATGKQQVGEAMPFDQFKQQHLDSLVGEVQGDARSPAEIAAILRAMSSNYSGGHCWDHLDAEVCMQAADALAAGRPGAQEPVGCVECPVTGLPFYDNMEHPKRGVIAMYGGPFDVFSIPELQENDGELRRERYDLDADGWVEGGEPLGYFYSDQQPDAAPPAQGIDLGPLGRLYAAYVRLLESGRDRIIDLGGTCDPVDVMERMDADLIEARNLLRQRDAAPGVVS